MIAKLDAQIEAMMIPFARQRDLLATIPGIGPKAAAAIISEIGASPGQSRYHRLVLRFGGYRNPAARKRAIVAIAHTLIVIIWHLLATGRSCSDLGADFYASRADPAHETRRLLARLEALGHKVTLEPAA
jgi:transposase